MCVSAAWISVCAVQTSVCGGADTNFVAVKLWLVNRATETYILILLLFNQPLCSVTDSRPAMLVLYFLSQAVWFFASFQIWNWTFVKHCVHKVCVHVGFLLGATVDSLRMDFIVLPVVHHVTWSRTQFELWGVCILFVFVFFSSLERGFSFRATKAVCVWLMVTLPGS